MKILISTSAVKFVAGDRVAAEFAKNDWSIGTVVKPTPTGYKIAFDWGEDKLIKADVKLMAVDSKRKIKRGLTTACCKPPAHLYGQ